MGIFTHIRLAAIFMLCLAAHAAAASGPGTGAADFLRIPVGARETSLGGAFTAVADNADAVFYNPAGLGLLVAPEVSYAYNDYLPGISQQWLAGAYPTDNGSVGLGLNYLSVSAFDSYDSADNRTGSVSASDLAVHLGYGGRLETALGFVPSLRYGAAVKYISERLDSSRASGYAFDAGLLLLTSKKGLTLGLGLENLAAGSLDFIGGGAKPPFKVKAGASYGLKTTGGAAGALLSLDLNFPADGPRYLSAGIESTLYGAFALRAGYSSFGDISSGLSFGLGFGLPVKDGREIRLDYSYGATYDLGNVHKLGLACKFGPVRSAARAETAPPAAPAPVVLQRAPAKEEDAEFKRRLAWLYSDSPQDSLSAAEYLAGVDSPMIDEHFTALLYSGKEAWKLAAVRGLALRKGDRSLALLEGALTHEDLEVRLRAALALGKRGQAGSAAALQQALKKEDSERVKSAIIEALSKLPAAVKE